MLKDYKIPLETASMPTRKRLKKLGTVKINAVETTPVVWNGRLLRFEWVAVRESNAQGFEARIFPYTSPIFS